MAMSYGETSGFTAVGEKELALVNGGKGGGGGSRGGSGSYGSTNPSTKANPTSSPTAGYSYAGNSGGNNGGGKSSNIGFSLDIPAQEPEKKGFFVHTFDIPGTDIKVPSAKIPYGGGLNTGNIQFDAKITNPDFTGNGVTADFEATVTFKIPDKKKN